MNSMKQHILMENSKVTSHVRFKILIIVFLLLAISCIFFYTIKAKEQTLEDEGDTRKIAVNEILKIKLDVNLSTGYKWFVKYKNNTMLDFKGYTFIPSDDAGDGEVGVGGVACFIFKAKNKGIDSLVFVRKRPGDDFSSKGMRKYKIYIN